MRLGTTSLRRRWPEALLITTVTLPWLALLALGTLWLWQRGYVWVWAILAAAFGLLAWPLTRLVRRRNNTEMRAALGERTNGPVSDGVEALVRGMGRSYIAGPCSINALRQWHG